MIVEQERQSRLYSIAPDISAYIDGDGDCPAQTCSSAELEQIGAEAEPTNSDQCSMSWRRFSNRSECLYAASTLSGSCVRELPRPPRAVHWFVPRPNLCMRYEPVHRC